ncbi:MAG: GNAT family N-acetyltransferase [Rhizobiales bacterium]|nr:GNAT family N-acetyltransferase [Rhizobacter sp.]
MDPLQSSMPLSLGWRTDLIFARFDGEVATRGDHLVVRTPNNPSFWWGNFLLFDHAPGEGDTAGWLTRFDAEITKQQPESRHITFGFDSAEPIPLPPDFARAGFRLFSSTVLTMGRAQLRAQRRALPDGFRIDTLRLPAQAAEAVELQVVSDAGESEAEADYRLFRQRQMSRYGAMECAGMGHWFAVFARGDDGAERMVAGCGLFSMPGEALGRFQHVETHPAWRRRGLCSALIHAVCRHGFERMGLETLVIVADPDDIAIGLYESLGFERGASTWHLEKAPPRSA